MFLARVRGSLTLNKTLPAITGKALRIVEEVDANDPDKPGTLFVSFDCVGAGEGQMVVWEGGPESAYAFFPDQTGSDANILAIVDRLNMERSEKD